MLHKSVRLSDVTLPDIQASVHLPIISHILDLVRERNISNRAEKLTDLERFKGLTSQ
jgi:hypothetical protein